MQQVQHQQNNLGLLEQGPNGQVKPGRSSCSRSASGDPHSRRQRLNEGGAYKSMDRFSADRELSAGSGMPTRGAHFQGGQTRESPPSNYPPGLGHQSNNNLEQWHDNGNAASWSMRDNAPRQPLQMEDTVGKLPSPSYGGSMHPRAHLFQHSAMQHQHSNSSMGSPLRMSHDNSIGIHLNRISKNLRRTKNFFALRKHHCFYYFVLKTDFMSILFCFTGSFHHAGHTTPGGNTRMAGLSPLHHTPHHAHSHRSSSSGPAPWATPSTTAGTPWGHGSGSSRTHGGSPAVAPWQGHDHLRSRSAEPQHQLPQFLRPASVGGGSHLGSSHTNYSGGSGQGHSNEHQKLFAMQNREIMRAAEQGRLIPLLEEFCRTKRRLNGVNVATALHRSAKFRSGPLPHFILTYICNQIMTFEGNFEPRSLGSALYGLQHQEDCEATRQVLMALAPKIEMCPKPFDAQAVGNALYGLQRFSDSESARAILRALAPKISQCSGMYVLKLTIFQIIQHTNQHISNSERCFNVGWTPKPLVMPFTDFIVRAIPRSLEMCYVLSSLR